MREEEKKEGGFQVKDRRRFNADGTAKEGAPPEEATVKAAPAPTPKPNPTQPKPEAGPRAPSPEGEINFPTFVLSLASSIQISLGLVPHPATGRPQMNLAAAKQSIDILGMLETKTKGNLTPDEAHLLQQVLFELRMQYVEIANPAKPKP